MNKKWWLINDDDVQIIMQGLDAPTHSANDYNCPDTWDYCNGCEGDEKRTKAQHALASGLHLTECIPDDFKVKEK